METTNDRSKEGPGFRVTDPPASCHLQLEYCRFGGSLPAMHSTVALLFSALSALPALRSIAQDDYKPGPDSIAQANVPKGELIRGTYTAKEGSVFPGTERDYTIYLPPRKGGIPAAAGAQKDNRDNSVVTPSPFMVFQDGVIYNAPAVFDNLIAKKEIPPLIGVFIRPGVVPAANPGALPRFNRSHEYDSVSDAYSRFLIEEFLPAIEAKHGIKVSTDPDDAAIAGNSSGGICAFMVAWHRPDRFRRVFSGVGTYVGIHGADRLPVLVRKCEPRPLRIHLQSGSGDNNLYCGDWWMANQTMERALTWAGYDVNHTWGTGGHNAKQATAIFPNVLRGLWKGWPEAKEIKANPRGESKWKGYEVIGDGKWEGISWPEEEEPPLEVRLWNVTANSKGEVLVLRGLRRAHDAWRIDTDHRPKRMLGASANLEAIIAGPNNGMLVAHNHFREEGERGKFEVRRLGADGTLDETWTSQIAPIQDMVLLHNGTLFSLYTGTGGICRWQKGRVAVVGPKTNDEAPGFLPNRLAVSPDQTRLYASGYDSRFITSFEILPDGSLSNWQNDCHLDMDDSGKIETGGLCVDTNGWLYVATALGIQVCDQAGRVNFIIPTPQQPHDVCFGGRVLGELFIACGDKIYKRPTKARGIVSGQMPPIRPAPPEL